MKVVIAGCGKVGFSLADRLNQEGHEVTLIEPNEKILRRALERLDVMGVIGSGADLKAQREADTKRADVLIAVTSSDEINMLCCLIAKKAGNCSTIARIRDPEYLDEVHYLSDELNLALVVNPEMAAAREVERLFRFPRVNEIYSFSRGHLELIRLKIPAESVLCHQKLKALGSRHLNILVCVIERNGEVRIPTGEDEILPNDQVSFITREKDLQKFFKQAGIAYKPVRSCLIVGGSKIAYYIAKHIQDDRMKVKVKIIESDEERCRYLAEQLPDVEIINGDGTDQELLQREGIADVDAFCALTGLDEENIMLSLYAGKLSDAHLVTKINHIGFDNVTSEMNLGTMIYPKVLVTDYIVQFMRALENSRGSHVRTLYKLADGRVETLEFQVQEKADFIGQPFATLRFKPNVLVGAIVRGREIITPTGADCMMAGDRVIIVTTHRGFSDLGDVLA